MIRSVEMDQLRGHPVPIINLGIMLYIQSELNNDYYNITI